MRVILSRRIHSTGSPPPRRIASIPNRLKTPNQAPGQLPASQTLVADYVSEEGIMNFMPSMQDITQSTVFLAVKSFALATLGVSIFAGTSVSLLIWRWDIRDVRTIQS